MGKKLEGLTPPLIEFINSQHLFFVGTAAPTGQVNISPKGMDTLRVLDSKEVIWLNLTGSGNETAAHLLQSDRMTIMFCAFEGKPLILRLYGTAKIYHPRDEEFENLISSFPKMDGSRQVIKLNIDLVQTSCGFGVPYLNFVDDRTILKDWAEKKGQEGIEEYWEEKNQKSIDGFDTEILV